ncbi:endonuclease [Aquimarina sp. 2304DJ70-9]|uniref:endonuclease n=1 Tax=Aquimarina penaris TaxID=3231044 RepID=UPI0034625FFC
MKKLLLLMLVISAIGYSQIPTYYNDVNLNVSGNALKNELGAKVTNTHVTFLTYTPGVWDALKQSDLDPTNASKVVLIYGYNDTDGNSTTDRTRGVNNNGGGSTDWNREHVYPKSLGNPNLGTEGAGADAHHLRPADVQRNSSRGSRKFADGSGNSGATAQGHWYPGDEFKGDVARMMMYMYIRYGNRTLPINVGVGATAASDGNMLQLFLEWNAEDPVSQLELQRNPILENIQGNRNPFIDNPAFATQIWGGPQAEDRFGNTGGGGTDTIAPSVPTNLTASNTTETSTTLSWNASTDNVGVTGYFVYQNGGFIGTATSLSYTVTGLTGNTSYTFTVKARDGSGNVSAASTAVNVTTQDNTSGGGAATELFFSEYIEGSSNNKALEIGNFTGGSVNLSGYSIKRQTNGSGSWSTALNLSGTIVNGDVYVVANGSASTSITNVADLTSGSSAMSFNGNDPVGLFKNGVLIDIIGTFNGGSSNFAKDVTLRRKASISSPSTTYTTTEWDSYSQNTFNDLGNHTFNGGGGNTDTTAPTVPANLAASNVGETTARLSWSASTDNTELAGYNVYQNGTFIVATSGTSYDVSGLSAGTTYTFTVNAYDAAGNTSVLSNSLNVTTAVSSDTQAPTVPANLTASNVGETTARLSWSASTDNVSVAGYNVYQNGTFIVATSGTTYDISGLTPGTTYTFEVNAYDASGNISAFSNLINVTTQDIVLTYCSSKGNTVSYEFIDYVGIGEISNATAANGGYGDFTSQVANLPYGSNTIVLSIGFVSSSYTENWGVWIDFNKNGSFESSEKVVTGSTSNSGNLSYSFTVPSTAQAGNTRMRVSMKWNGAPTSCETFGYGEVEDYSVNIGASSVRAIKNTVHIDGELGNEAKVYSARVFPNPASEFISIGATDNREVNFKLINLHGSIVKSGKTTRSQIALDRMQAGMYILEISDNGRTASKKIIIE